MQKSEPHTEKILGGSRPSTSSGLPESVEGRRPASTLQWAAYSCGRLLQLIGMWLLLVALFTAGPVGPSPRVFGAGVGVFVAGWAVVRFLVGRRA